MDIHKTQDELLQPLTIYINVEKKAYRSCHYNCLPCSPISELTGNPIQSAGKRQPIHIHNPGLLKQTT